ncbi:hypothetical protein [Flavobacterium sp.]|uniref:hypothetical protein n=1 Tax=Flavobacterium sp. TaxID=239 RepID=UPI00248A1137|nr:hypothetical protein [Flavobacterium sp.]MDI1316910.1 hypothetical protein [Flavobacterium sp.]
MRILQIILLVFISNAFSQTSKDLYITYIDGNLKNRTEASDKNNTIEIFRIQILTENPYKYILVFDKLGHIQIQTQILGASFPTFKFTYLNRNGDNAEKKVSKDEMKNVLEFNELQKLTNAENFYETLNKFENIYFVFLKNENSQLIAKKVKFEREPGL